ncbi:MAG: PhoH family protein [Ignavibacteriaceae bacterium]|nr:PhoH family protein [Ignavibacteriaceae bacterium]
MEKTLRVESTDVPRLLGVNDVNLRVLENSFSASIVARGEQFFVKGVDEEVEQIEKVLKEMIYVLNTTSSLKESDVKMLVELTRKGQPVINEEEYDSIVFYAKNDTVRVKTEGQKRYLVAARRNDICFAIGPAGTGKTYLAVALALAELKKGNIRKLILTRPAVEAGERLGFLPGDLRDKIDPYLRPLYDALEDMLGPEKLKTHLEKGIVEIIPLAYMRGRTLNRAFIILDEAQNTTDVQMKMFLTRIGVESKAIITGDVTQIDLPNKQVSGLIRAQEILSSIEGISFVYFEKSDVVRHKLVKDIINAYEKFWERDTFRNL